MRRSLVRCLSVSVLLVSMSLPAQAAPRRDDGSGFGSGLFERLERIAQLIKHVVAPLDVPGIQKP